MSDTPLERIVQTTARYRALEAAAAKAIIALQLNDHSMQADDRLDDVEELLKQALEMKGK